MGELSDDAVAGGIVGLTLSEEDGDGETAAVRQGDEADVVGGGGASVT